MKKIIEIDGDMVKMITEKCEIHKNHINDLSMMHYRIGNIERELEVIDTRVALISNEYTSVYKTMLAIECEIAQELQDMFEGRDE